MADGPASSLANALVMTDSFTAARAIPLEEIEAARSRIAGTVVRTPLLELQGTTGPRIFLKLENLQPINSFKLRGAANAVAMLEPEKRALGVWTISAGNAGQGVAYAARAAGVPCTVVAIETAPETKIARMRALGATIVKASFDACWEALGRRSFPGIDGTCVHPFDDDHFIAGNATAGLEIVEDLPDVATVVTAIGGGGLVTGVASAVRARKRDVRVLVAEPETAAPYARSLQLGKPSAFEDWRPSFVDGAGGKSIFAHMWERMLGLVDGSVVVTLEQTRNAMRVLAERTRVIAEGAGALPVAAALSGKAGDGPIVAVISGGNIDLATFVEAIATAG
jgi:threonine dehydratase